MKFCSLVLLSLLVLSSPVAALDMGSWSYKMPVTFSGYDKSETLTNFPVLVQLSTNVTGFSYDQFGSPADGADLRFVASDETTELNYSISSWNTNGVSHAWVQIPALASSNDFIYAIWGNHSASAPNYTTNGATWSAGFQGVWHMQNATNVLDSSGKANHGTGSTGIGSTNAGIAGNALSLNGHYVDCGTGLNMRQNDATLSIWFKTSTATFDAGLIGKSVYGDLAGRYSFHRVAANVSGFAQFSAQVSAAHAWNYSDGEWHQATVTYKRNGNMTVYVDGVQKAATSISAHSAYDMNPANIRFWIGVYGNSGGTGPQAGFYFPGHLDEARMLNVAVSSNWVWSTWANQRPESTFLSYGTAEAQSTDLAVSALPVSDLGTTTATANGKIIQTGGAGNPFVHVCLDHADRDTGATSAWARVDYVGADWGAGQSFSWPLTGLLAGSNYAYRVYVTNTSGDAWSDPQQFMMFSLPSVSNPGANPLRETAVLNGEITHTGNDTPTTWFYYWPDSGSPTSEVPAGLQSGSFSASVSGLTPGETYAYRILASNIAGTVWSDTKTFTTASGSVGLYVSPNGPVGGIGANWATAFTNVQDAVNAVTQPGDTIYLAGQTFPLTNQLVWTATDGVTLRGGYAATNSADTPGTSDPDQWPTVLTRANPAVNHRILRVQNVTNGTLQAVTITGGLIGAHGGGVYVENASLTMNRCDINSNFTSGNAQYGGGIYFHGGTLLVTNCVIRNNSVYAGDNGTSAGGGIWIQSGTAMIRDSIIRRNSATTVWNTSSGGGVVNNTGTVDLVNCLIVGNRCLAGSAVYAVGASSVTRMLNCTIVHNLTGAAVQRANGTMTMTNSIAWRNQSGDLSGTITLAHSNIEAGTGSGSNGNISSDPGFEHGYYLAAGSASRNAGTGATFLLDSGYTTQTSGEVETGAVDLGFHYRQGFDLSRIDLYVCPETGNNENIGTSSNQPLRTLTHALTRTIDGGRIHLASGVYGQGQETFPLVLADRVSLSLLGQGPTNTILNATNSSQRVMDIQLGGQSRIEGIGIMGGRAAQGAGVRLLNAAHVTLVNCEIYENLASSSGSQGAGIYTDGGTLIVTNSIIRNNLASGDNASGGGVWVNAGVFMMRDSALRENRAMTVWRDPYGGGLHNVNGSVSLVNCLITANRCLNSSAVNNQNSLAQLHILNCTITDNLDGPAVRRANGTLSVTNSILWNNASDISGTVSLGYSNIQGGNGAGSNGNISSNPLFEFGYYLAEGSPSRDAGTHATFLLGSGYTTRITGEDDTEPVDMGYHYRQGVDLGFADIYVSNAGSNANKGTNWAEAFQTITHALTKVMNGSRVHVAAGTYAHPSETFPLTFSGVQGVSLLGVGSGETIINATGSGQRVLTWHVGGSSRIEGVTLTGGYSDQGGGIHFLGASDVLVRDCIVSGNTISKDHPYGGGVYLAASTVVFEDGKAWNNLVSGTYWGSQTYGAAFYVASGANLTLNRVDIRGNRPNHQGERRGAVFNLGTLLMRNCVVAGNTSFLAGGGVNNAGGNATIQNSTITGNAIHGVNRSAGTLSVTNSILWNNTTADVAGEVAIGYSLIGTGTGIGSNENISADPLFVDAADGDYRLGTGSPAANKGIKQAWMTSAAKDLAGDPRVQGGKVDMGAYESAMGSGTMILFR